MLIWVVRGLITCGRSTPVGPRWALHCSHLSYSLNSLKGCYIGDYMGVYYRVFKGDTRSLDYSTPDRGSRLG